MGFSFEQVNATDYDELRPTYAPEAVRWVAERARLEPGSLVVDLAAGTGQLSRRFASLGDPPDGLGRVGRAQLVVVVRVHLLETEPQRRA